MFKLPPLRALVRVAGLFAAFALATGGANAQSDWPSKPVRIVVPFAPGGSTGVLAQLLAARLAEQWGQQVVVDPRGGGNTVIGTEHVAKSAPDGYTLMLTSNSHVVIPQLITTAFDPIKDFAPVATISSTELVLTLNPAVPAQTLSEFIALAKAKPGQINYASAGTSSATHLAGEMLGTLAGIKIQHVPYKGSGPAIADLLGGQVQMSFQTPIVAIPYIQTHKLKALAVSGKARLAALPEVPTFDEAGLAGFNATTWFGIVAPAGVPQPVIAKVSQDIEKIINTPAFRTKLSDLGMDPLQMTPAQFADLIKTTQSLTAKVIKASNIKLE